LINRGIKDILAEEVQILDVEPYNPMMNIFTTTAYPVLKETEDIPSEETKEGTTKDGDRPHRYYPQIDES